MLTSIYVVDYILHALESAKPVYDRIFATEPLWINPDMAPVFSAVTLKQRRPRCADGVCASQQMSLRHMR